ncbi:hypothetical protein FRC20_009335 [Serendipita sp. 405]|nr:hypothetical protein FRC15_006305 [Serendipita sp. 397]KAG8878050.1 hypothetical protein FRC20_009335 [Serendipita sp. 405]
MSTATVFNVRRKLGNEFYWGRPSRTDLIPITLLHEVFREFVHDLSNYQPNNLDFEFAATLKRKMMKTYSSESKRCNWFRRVWEKYCSRLDPAGIKECTTDGHLEEGNSYLIITEGKREMDANEADPLLQAAMYYVKVLREQPRSATDTFPCLIIYYMGSTIGFAGAVWSNIPQIVALTPIFTFHAELSTSEMALQVARALGATKNALTRLRTHYGTTANALNLDSLSSSPSDEGEEEEEDLLKDPDVNHRPSSLKSRARVPLKSKGGASKVSLSSSLSFPSSLSKATEGPQAQPAPYLFPDICHFMDKNGERIEFLYDRRLIPNKLLFLVTSSKGQLLVKFTTTYCVAAHDHCAQHGIAPTLYAVEHLKAGWLMVVMEYLDHNQYTCPSGKTPGAKQFVANALKTLHNGGYVHGDFRDVNVFIREMDNEEFEVKILDYDWAGKYDEARYPNDVNFLDIYRPPGVDLGGVIFQRHDEEMLKHIFSVKR